ncbi:hypothetical protein FIBSPDRAFT_661337, partial [Athelia psychrophila]
NIPSPASKWYTVLGERILITIWALLVPEYIIAWAIRQWIVARQISKEFNKLQPRSDSLTVHLAWTVTHGFFVLMGGFYFEGDGPQHPISREDLAAIITKTQLELLKEADINDKSKGDGFSKTVTVIQTLWFVAQCLARAIQGLTITKLEIVTLAYTAISMAMYYFWWSKPLSVNRPIWLKRVAGLESHPSVSSGSPSNTAEVGWSARIKTFVQAVVGTQDDEVHLSELRQVPTFYAGKPEEHHVLVADAIALAFAMVFGAVHCIAWSFAFPSRAEKLLWRISAV